MSNIARGGKLAFNGVSGVTYLDYNNNGVITAKDAKGELGGNISSSTGTGEVIIDNNGTIQFDQSVTRNTIQFVDNTGVLIIEQLGNISLSVSITGLQSGDTIEIPNLPDGFVENYSTTTGNLVISDASGNDLGTLIFGGSQLPSESMVLDAVVRCFAAGTRIATPTGYCSVEKLRAGAAVRLCDGTDGKIIWTGFRQIDCERHPAPENVRPFRIAAHAFSRNSPNRTLFLSPDHAVFVEGVLIPIKYLANGSTIQQVRVPSVEYYHIELHHHAIVEADGLAVETLLPGSDKSSFADSTNVTRLHPEFSSLNWEARGYAPLTVTGPLFDVIKQRIQNRAKSLDVRGCGPAEGSAGIRQDGHEVDLSFVARVS